MVLDPTSKEEEDYTAFVYSLQSKSVEESKVYFDDINDEFISKHMTLRLHHIFEILVEESKDPGKVGRYLSGINLGNSQGSWISLVFYGERVIHILYTMAFVSILCH